MWRCAVIIPSLSFAQERKPINQPGSDYRSHISLSIHVKVIRTIYVRVIPNRLHLPNTISPNAVSESRMDSWSNLSNVSQNCTLVAVGKKSFIDWKVENNTFLTSQDSSIRNLKVFEQQILVAREAKWKTVFLFAQHWSLYKSKGLVYTL